MAPEIGFPCPSRAVTITVAVATPSARRPLTGISSIVERAGSTGPGPKVAVGRWERTSPPAVAVIVLASAKVAARVPVARPAGPVTAVGWPIRFSVPEAARVTVAPGTGFPGRPGR